MSRIAEAQAAAAESRESRAALQPSGFMLGLSSDWRVTCASANITQFTGIPISEVLGRPIASFLGSDAVHLIRNRVALLRDDDSPERLIDQQLIDQGARFDACLRQLDGSIVLEVVPGTDSGGIDVAGAVERMLRRVQYQEELSSLTDAATRELRGLTGFDAIQIYRNSDPAPECVSSFIRSGLSAFEPANVRPASLQRPLWIADIDAKAVPILCPDEERSGMGASLLAPAEPALAEEIRRTGARSAVLLPIAGERRPWGFALALHRNARAPRLARLSVAELFTHVCGLRIQALEGR